MDGNASRMKGNEGILARVQEIVGRAAERAEVSLERVLRELAAIAFSDISKAVTWGPSVQVREEEEGRGRPARQRSSPALFRWCRATGSTQTRRRRSQCSRRARRARSALGKHLGMFDHTQKTNVVYAISDKPMSAE